MKHGVYKWVVST